MAGIRIQIDKRNISNDNTCPVRIVVSLFGKKFYLATGVYVAVEPPSKGGDDAMLIASMRELRDMKTGRTCRVYNTTIRKLQRYYPSDVRMRDINRSWLENFRTRETSRTSINTAAVDLTLIRATFNYIIDNERITNYPFRRFKIKRETTAKRSLTIEQLAALRQLPCTHIQTIYRDIFFLSLYLVGINPVDLFNLTADSLQAGRIKYNRSKTKRFYNVKVEPEAMEIIMRYKGKRFLLSPMDNINFEKFHGLCNLGLHRIGGKMEKAVPKLSMYWARHTWATIAARIDIPDATISKALGHGTINPVTAIYINYDQRKVDEANRKVIDYIKLHA